MSTSEQSAAAAAKGLLRAFEVCFTQLMTDHTARDGTMTRETRLGVAVAVETKTMKPRFHSDLKIGARTTMTMDAGVESAAIGIVVVADKTVDGNMSAVIEVQWQRLCAAQQRFTESEAGSTPDERAECKHRGNDDTRNECRVTSER